MKVSGEFEVNIKPLDFSSQGRDEINLGRMSIDKKFSGGLAGTSNGEMLSAVTPTKGSAGYVAIEQVNGNLEGKTGSFVLQHFGIMSANTNRLILEVVPNSGTGELVDLTGKMSIKIENGKHFYEFDYNPGK